MNRSIATIALLTGFPTAVSARSLNPTYAWKLGNTTDPPSGVGTRGGPPGQPLIDAVGNSGFNVVRVPCAWNPQADQTPYQIDPT